jgi:hypothetical protein
LRLTRPKVRRVIGALLAALVASGCGERRAAVRRECVEARAGGLTGASASSPAGLTSGEQAAIGALTNADGETVCTGTLVGDGCVLTAAHCVHPELSEALLFDTTDGMNDLRLLVSSYWIHPTLDAMLLALPIARGAFPGWITPLPVVTDAQRVWTGTELLLVGFGEDENGVDGVRRYVAEPVVEEDPSWLVVDGGSSHGACAKDSGGPLVSVGGGAATSVLGLLSSGSATCRGKDRYLRASSLIEWLDSTMAEIAADPCNGVSAEGTCTDGQAKWCAGGVLESEVCSGHRLCGWSDAVGGYRCLVDGEDPCRGAGPVGTCDGDVLLRCDRGTLLETDCSACGQACVAGPREAARCR